MVKRSLQTSPAGTQQARRAFALKGWTQANLAGEVNLKTRQPIWRFFTEQPVDRQIFLEICSVLELDWREIAVDPPADFPESSGLVRAPLSNIDALVQQVRSQRRDKVQDQCGTLQLLDIGHPVSLDDMYIDVNVLKSIASLQWSEVSNPQTLEPAAFERFGLGEVDQNQVLGLTAVEHYSKVRMLGRPGSGKTTFLQYLAVQCNQGEWESERVPIFITLRHFVEESKASGKFSLLDYIRHEFLTSDITDPSAIETLLQAGKGLVLLDGIDEVLNHENAAVLKEIRRFSDKYHKNLFVVTCRTAAQKFSLRGFTDVEVAPFTEAQITTFAQKWFIAFTKTTEAGRAKATQFIEKLDLPENWQFRQMVVTPLFLHLACWVFQGQGRFPTKRTEFYKEGLDLLLGKWDEARGVERDEAYQGFRLPQKLKLLSQIAAATFEQGQYFFEQRVVEQQIEDYIRCLPNASTDAEELQLESEAVLKAIESQHGLLTERSRGIFSFSYLAFQEYFTARNIVASHNLQGLEQALDGLVSHLSDPHWREIFLLTAAMLRSADSLVQLMKQQIDALVAKDPYLQEFLTWANQKSQTVPAETQDATVRAFYLAIARTPYKDSDFALACTLDQGMFLDVALDDLMQSCVINQSLDFAHAYLCGNALSNILGTVLDAGFHKSLQQLQKKVPKPAQNQEQSQTWWKTNHTAWAEELKQAIDHYRQIHHHWQFSPEQEQVLQRYYAANQLLLDCLHSNCEVTTAIRQDIEATLLLPQQELEAREWQ